MHDFIIWQWPMYLDLMRPLTPTPKKLLYLLLFYCPTSSLLQKGPTHGETCWCEGHVLVHLQELQGDTTRRSSAVSLPELTNRRVFKWKRMLVRQNNIQSLPFIAEFPFPAFFFSFIGDKQSPWFIKTWKVERLETRRLRPSDADVGDLALDLLTFF